ncbi:adenylate/guanylate cyclase domain-containing protein [Spongiactinospora sp. TRM90649]|uniref:adenylate/guanylate cyclase domain-containing protein n=1 Tax=Spongiactinospora sp. TRM90649 TaxID=3031114 RepID=UPI0023F67E8A|nr:adenylate/guanylate cyclase domain-containing protein [Spongiactinospora sp. TRM90649]MDF5754443.1 adenylate/guanylate cyclase domain-containing protein [Spongiactinospora sp. TRM90649]
MPTSDVPISSPEQPEQPYLPPATHPVRSVVWTIHMVIPMAGLWLLLANPGVLNIVWQHEPSHFWLILLVAGINLALGLLITRAMDRRADARLLLVSMVFLTNAGFFLLHGLSTPKILLPAGSVGFDVDQPVGLTIASVFAFASALPLHGRAARAVLGAARSLRAGLAVLLVGWGVASLVPGLTPLSGPPPEGGAGLGAFSLVAVVLYSAAAAMMFRLHRRRPAAMLISLITAYALLAEAMVAGMSKHNWHLSWWEWHLLLTLAFVFVAYSAYLQFRREGSSAGMFDSIALAATVRRLQTQYAEALEELVGHLRRRAVSDVPVATRLAGKFGLTEAQAAVLDRAGEALANERELSERLGALVDVGRGARVGLAERELLAESLDRVRQAYGDVRIGLVADGRVAMGGTEYGERDFPGGEPIRDGERMVHPLTVKGRLAGAIRVPVGRTPQDEPLATLLAGQISIALENARLYAELSTLFRQYMSPDVAAALLADPGQAALGGSLVELTSLFADLKGFTTFSERVTPGEIVEMLNRYHTAAVPCVLDNGGTIVQFVGDALLALFNAPARQSDHALAAARAGLAMQRAAERVAAEVAGEQAAGRMNGVEWPKFRVGVNTGPALVGNIGSPELRGFNAMGDCVNVAARLQALAEPGTVVIGSTTRDLLGRAAAVTPLGPLTLKGKEEPVSAFVLNGLTSSPRLKPGDSRG